MQSGITDKNSHSSVFETDGFSFSVSDHPCQDKIAMCTLILVSL